MPTNNVVRGSQDDRRDDLDSRYGEIGISAVAAALKFKSKTNSLAYAPVVPQLDKWLVDEAA
jgi:hypothetical protein